jgi:hypothetical protein
LLIFLWPLIHVQILSQRLEMVKIGTVIESYSVHISKSCVLP